MQMADLREQINEFYPDLLSNYSTVRQEKLARGLQFIDDTVFNIAFSEQALYFTG